MDMTGEYRIAAPRSRVWEGLNDPEVLRQCITGCEEVDKVSDTEFTAKVTAKVGPVKARFGGRVTMSDLDPPNGYTITGEGTGGAAGFAKGGAKVALSDDGEGTLLRYEVQANVGGKLAQIGSRLIDATARKMADEFFSKFAALLAASTLEAAAAAPPSEAAAAGLEPAAAERVAAAASNPAAAPIVAPPADTAAPPFVPPPPGSAATAMPPARGGLPPAVWIIAVVAIVAVLLLVFR